MSSLSSNPASRSGSSHISKTYRQASSLFLTRRLPEALSTVLPLISPPTPDNPDGVSESAPIAQSSRSTRIKVWSLYLTILNAAAELDADAGKAAFGAQEWRSLTAKVRDGDIWEEVVQNGYYGVEGNVDSEVVINLSTLLLAHAQTQIVNQRRLENYLSSCSSPTFDISTRLQRTQSPRIDPRYRSPAKGASGADTPRDLNARVKILELYTLHVLVRNNEWEQSRGFINTSPALDEERREAFLQALQSLQDDHQAEKLRQVEAEQSEIQRREELEKQSRLQEEKKRQEERALAEKRAKDDCGQASHHDLERGLTKRESGSFSKKSKRRELKGCKGSAGGAPKKNQKPILPKGKNGKPSNRLPSLPSKAVVVLSNIGAAIESLGASLRTNPTLIVRALALLMGILIVFGRKGIRQKLSRLFRNSWNKVLATAGMGVKVSYI